MQLSRHTLDHPSLFQLTRPAWSLICQQLMGGWWLICSAHTSHPHVYTPCSVSPCRHSIRGGSEWSKQEASVAFTM